MTLLKNSTLFLKILKFDAPSLETVPQLLEPKIFTNIPNICQFIQNQLCFNFQKFSNLKRLANFLFHRKSIVTSRKWNTFANGDCPATRATMWFVLTPQRTKARFRQSARTINQIHAIWLPLEAKGASFLSMVPRTGDELSLFRAYSPFSYGER